MSLFPPIVRRTFALGCAGFILLAPAVRMVWRVENPVFPSWRMFHGNGRDLCTVQYHGPEGEPIDRLRSLGHHDPLFAPKSVKRIHKVEVIERQGRDLCKTLNYRRITVDASCSQRNWTMKRVLPRDRNLCERR